MDMAADAPGFLELDDDPETLRAALAMIDALDSEDTGADAVAMATVPVSPSELDETTQDEEEEEKKKKKKTEEEQLPTPTATLRKVNLSRARRQQELAHLRDKMKTMQASLSSLKRAREEDENGARGGEGSGKRAWQAVAADQSYQRRVAQLENARLRALLRSQMRAGKDLIRLLRAQPGKEEVHTIKADQMTPSSSSTGRNRRLCASESEQLARVEEIYRAQATWFPETVFHPHAPTFRDIQIEDDDPEESEDGPGIGATTVTIRISWELPFTARSVADAVWQTAVRKLSSRNCELQDVTRSDAPQDTLMAVFRGAFEPQATPGSLAPGISRGHLIARRFQESEQQTVFVSVMRADLFKGLDDVSFLEDSVIRVVHVTNGPAKPLTRVQYSRKLYVTAGTNSATASREKIGVLVEFVLLHIEEEMKWKQRLIEQLVRQHSSTTENM